MNIRREPLLKRLPALFEIPAPDPSRGRRRIELMELRFMLPIRTVFVALIFFSFNYTPWIGQISSALDVTVETVQLIFWVYILLSILMAMPLFYIRGLPLALLQWLAVTSALVDSLLVAAMTLITGGTDSILFWLFPGLILRNSASVPPGVSQLILNFMTSLCYALVAGATYYLAPELDEIATSILDIQETDILSESLVLRMLVLWLTAACCYGVQAFLERQRIASEETAEFMARENQLHAAGRQAAEIAHQIKNPLAVITNAAYSLRRSVKKKSFEIAEEQISIIEEEVSRADRVITRIMGYAQLSEGHVEKLDVISTTTEAMEQVFPAAVSTGIHLEYEHPQRLPPLLMQRNHLLEILVNLLQNAREAIGERGTVSIRSVALEDHSIEIAVADNGPGISPDKQKLIFEAYFTTKEKGTGLGLSIVKHNAELYGGNVRLDSTLGKGTCFTVTFPHKTLPRHPTP